MGMSKIKNYPYEYFKSIADYKKLVGNLKKEDFFSKLRKDYPKDKEIEPTKEKIKLFNIKNGEELTKLYFKKDGLLSADIFEKYIKVSFEEFDINLLYCVSLTVYTWLCGLE